MSGLHKRSGPGGASPAGAQSGPDPWVTSYPRLMEYLCEERYADGTPRRTATLLLFVDAGQAKACLNDRDQDLSAWVAGGSMAALLEALERGLAGDCLEWRRPSNRSPKKR